MRISFRLEQCLHTILKGAERGLLYSSTYCCVVQVAGEPASQPAAELSGSQVQPKGGGIQVFRLVLAWFLFLFNALACVFVNLHQQQLKQQRQQLLPANICPKGGQAVDSR